MAKASGKGSKHSTSDEMKALHAASNIGGGYCSPPEGGKFRSGDRRKRGGPRKPKAEVKRALSVEDLDELSDTIANSPLSLRDKTTGELTRVTVTEAVLRREVADALNGNPTAQRTFLARREKALRRKDQRAGDLIARVVQFITDTHAGRYWLLNDFTRDVLIEAAEQSGKLQLLGMLVEALQIHADAESPRRAATRNAPPTQPASSPRPSPDSSKSAAAAARPNDANKASGNAKKSNGEPRTNGGPVECPEKGCAYLDAIRAPRACAAPAALPGAPSLETSTKAAPSRPATLEKPPRPCK